jgi:hypothetical protein
MRLGGAEQALARVLVGLPGTPVVIQSGPRAETHSTSAAATNAHVHAPPEQEDAGATLHAILCFMRNPDLSS